MNFFPSVMQFFSIGPTFNFVYGIVSPELIDTYLIEILAFIPLPNSVGNVEFVERVLKNLTKSMKEINDKTWIVSDLIQSKLFEKSLS